MKQYKREALIRGQFTFRNPLWDSFLKFLDDFRKYPMFEDLDEGKHKNSLDQVYEKAINKMRLDNTDFTTIALKFVYLGEHDVSGDFIEYMNECENIGRKCYTTKDGEKIIKEAEIIVEKRKQDTEIKSKIAKAQAELDEAEEKRKAYFDEQNRITEEWEIKRQNLEVLKNAVPDFEKYSEEIENEPEEKKPTVITNEYETEDSMDENNLEAEVINE